MKTFTLLGLAALSASAATLGALPAKAEIAGSSYTISRNEEIARQSVAASAPGPASAATARTGGARVSDYDRDRADEASRQAVAASPASAAPRGGTRVYGYDAEAASNLAVPGSRYFIRQNEEMVRRDLR